MAEKTLSVRIQQKSDTALNWLNNNPILLLGEFGVETDTQKMKVGNGVNTWTELPYIISDVDLPIVIEGNHSFKRHIEFQKGINVMNPITLFGNYSISLVNGLSFSGTEIDLGDNKVSLIVRAIDRPTFNNGKKLDKFAFISDIPAVPTKTSELENDSNFATTNQIPTNNNQLTNGAGYITKSSLPTKTSQLTNDSGYITSSSIPTNYVTTNTQQEVPAGKLFTKKLNNSEALIGVVSNNHEASIIYRTNRGNDIVAGVGCGGASYANSFSIWDYAVNRVIAHFNSDGAYTNGYQIKAFDAPYSAKITIGSGDNYISLEATADIMVSVWHDNEAGGIKDPSGINFEINNYNTGGWKRVARSSSTNAYPKYECINYVVPKGTQFRWQSWGHKTNAVLKWSILTLTQTTDGGYKGV